ncbi:Na(+)/H(+) antiporter subunit D [Rickettsiales bacterium]|nr:Na(+)/H(+) antiporter subunit D [Rickettsiales bacterium]
MEVMMPDLFSSVPPGLILIIGSLFLPLFKGNLRHILVIILPILTLAQVWNVQFDPEDLYSVPVAGFNLYPLYMHSYTLVFATVFSIAAFAGGLYALKQAKVTELVAAYIYAGSAIGVTFSGDFLSLFFFWELMAIGSTIVIFVSSSKESNKAGLRYAMMHFFGGVLLMGGIVVHIIISGGDVMIRHLDADLTFLLPLSHLDMNGISLWLMLIGVLINAAAPPFSAWLADAYPEGSPSGSVFLSAFTTKTAVFVLLTVFAGAKLLIIVGLFMVFYGIIMAILENDMRRILSYSIVNQVGFMVTGIGIGTTLALNGVAMHAFCHIIYKALLFMSAGSVLYMTGKSRCTELGGLYRTMKLTAICGIIGALAISAFPLTSGFVSKSLIASAAQNEKLGLVWLLLLMASAGVFLHAGVKFPWFVFFQKDSGMRPKDPPWNMKLAMILFSALCIIPAIPGVAEQTIYKLLPNEVTYQSYTPEHVVGQLQLLLFSGFAFFLMLPLLKRTKTISLDFDWFYRGLAYYFYAMFKVLSKRPVQYLRILGRKALRKSYFIICHVNGPGGVLARSWSVGVTILWALVLFGIYMSLYYIKF